MMQFSVSFRYKEEYSISMEEEKKSFSANFGQIQTVTKIDGDIERYVGPYEVTPDAHDTDELTFVSYNICRGISIQSG